MLKLEMMIGQSRREQRQKFKKKKKMVRLITKATMLSKKMKKNIISIAGGYLAILLQLGVFQGWSNIEVNHSDNKD